jgi:hypothetical protein
MALFRIRPTQADIEIAERISDRAGPEIEQLARILPMSMSFARSPQAGGSSAGVAARSIVPTAIMSCSRPSRLRCCRIC